MNRLALVTALGLASTASAQVNPGSGSGMPTMPGPGSGSGVPTMPGPGSGSGMPTMPTDSPTMPGPGSGSGSSSWCGDGQATGGEACDDGMWNGQPGYCNATCTGVIRRSPFNSPDEAPVLQQLTHGRVLASRHYEAELPLGELPGVGKSPGFSLAIRLRSDGDAGACGPACTVQATTATLTGGAYVVTEAGVTRRFEPFAGAFREVAPPGTAITPATAALVAGNLVVSEPDGQLTRTFDPAGRERTRATPWGALTLGYDGAGRLTTATNAAGATLTAAYDGSGRLATVTDPTGFAITVRYAGDGHAISLEGPADGQVTPNLSIGWMANEITSLGRLGFAAETISYDRGLVTFARSVDGNAYAFDSNASQVVVADAQLQYRRMTYDANQRVAMVETNAGAQTTYVRDGFGRVTSTHYATGSGELVESVVYDGNGRMTSMTDTGGAVTQLTYDAAGNLTSTTSGGATTSFAYTNGRLTSTTDPLGRVTTKTYDANGLETSTTSLGVTLSATYTARGQVATATDGRGVTTTFTYDNLGRLTSQAQPGTPTVTITRTPAGAGEQVVIARGGETRTVLTDRYDRVISESSSQGTAASYTYDPITGLRAESTATFRGKTQTSRRTYTNTGDTAQMWVNGQQRQAAARIVPPGNAWIQP
jgi:YD repeat-containing protein